MKNQLITGERSNMKLLEDVYKAREEHEKLYEDLHNDPIDLDVIFELMINSIHESYIGRPDKKRYFTPAEYRTYILSHHRYGNLTLQMLVRSMHQFAGDMHDRRLRFHCDDWVDYKNVRADFRVRAYEDALYVTSAEQGSSLKAGDKILKLQRLTPERVRELTRHNCFYSREKERELWGGYLSMAENAEVEHADGSTELVNLAKLPGHDDNFVNEFKMLGNDAYLRLESMDYAAVSAILEENKEKISAADKLIIDLRRNIGGEGECAELLLPYVINRDYSLSVLEPDEGYYTNFTKQNCELRYALLTALREGIEDPDELAIIDSEIKKYTSNYGRGVVFIPPENTEDNVIKPSEYAAKKTVIITDTFCENEAERFVLMAKNAGIKTVGRPTMGNLDYFDEITLAINKHMTLTYPISQTAASREGRGFAEKGIPADEYIPWTPEEIEKDILLARAQELN